MSNIFWEEFLSDIMIDDYFSADYFIINKTYSPVGKMQRGIEMWEPKIIGTYDLLSWSNIFKWEVGSSNNCGYRIFIKFHLILTKENLDKWRNAGSYNEYSIPNIHKSISNLLDRIYKEYVDSDRINKKYPLNIDIDITEFLSKN